MKKKLKLVSLFSIPALAAGAAAAAIGREMCIYATRRDNSKGLVSRLEQKKAEKSGPERSEAFQTYMKVVEEGKKWFLDQGPEEVDILSYDGLRLHAYYLPAYKNQSSLKTMVLMHGYRCDAQTDLAHTYRHFHELGYNLLAPSQRAHGKSEGQVICYGTKERFDVQKWCEYLVTRLGEDQRIDLMGISMGAATVMMAAGVNLPKQVDRIIEDCGFTSPEEEFLYQTRQYPGKTGKWIVEAANTWSKYLDDFNYKSCSTLDAMKKNTHPTLFIHGDSDDFVPTRFTYENYKACSSEKELVIIKGAKHANSGIVDPETYFSAIDRFLAKSDPNTRENEAASEESADESADKSAEESAEEVLPAELDPKVEEVLNEAEITAEEDPVADLHTFTKSGLIPVPKAAADYQGQIYTDVIYELMHAGFQKVEADRRIIVKSWNSKADRLTDISIGGRHDFQADDLFEADAEVLIVYESYGDEW